MIKYNKIDRERHELKREVKAVVGQARIDHLLADEDRARIA